MGTSAIRKLLRQRNPILSLLIIPSISIFFAALLLYSERSVSSQNKNSNTVKRNPSGAIQLPPRPKPTPTPESSTEVVTVDVDLVKVDALVLQKQTARIVGG